MTGMVTGTDAGCSSVLFGFHCEGSPRWPLSWYSCRMRLVVVLSLLVLQTPEAVFAYEEVDVLDGGTLEGQVRYRGENPGERFLPVLKNRDVCGDRVPDSSLLVSEAGGLANVIVELEGVSSGKKKPRSVQLLDNKECSFEPRVQSLVVGQSLMLANSDPILHDAHAWLGRHTVFNLGLPPWRRVEHRFDAPGIHSVDCNVLHTWMKAWVFVSEHPYVAVTDRLGRFSLAEVPPGNYRLRLWHETLGEQRTQVEIPPRARVDVSFEFSDS